MSLEPLQGASLEPLYSLYGNVSRSSFIFVCLLACLLDFFVCLSALQWLYWNSGSLFCLFDWFFFVCLSFCPAVLMEEFRASHEQTSVLSLIWDSYFGFNLYLSHVWGFPRVPLEELFVKGVSCFPLGWPRESREPRQGPRGSNSHSHLTLTSRASKGTHVALPGPSVLWMKGGLGAAMWNETVMLTNHSSLYM